MEESSVDDSRAEPQEIVEFEYDSDRKPAAVPDSNDGVDGAMTRVKNLHLRKNASHTEATWRAESNV
jgi:hypothetical protein